MDKQLAHMREVIRLEGEALFKLADNLGKGVFANALTLISKCRGKVVLSGIGKSGHVGRKISSTLASTGCASYFIHPTEASHGDLGMLSVEDVVVVLSNSGESAELQDIIVYCQRYNIPIVAITGNPKSMLAGYATILLPLPKVKEACPLGLAPTTSTTMMLALGDALALALLELKGFSRSDFKNIHPGGALGTKLLRVQDLMHTGEELPLVAETQTMDEALLLMTGKRFGCVGVVSPKGELKGIVTDGDLRRSMSDGLLAKKASQVMTKNPTTISSQQLAVVALRLMNEKAITTLFVCHKNAKPCGILHIHDCIRAGL